MIKENCGPRILDPTNADFSFPKARFKFLPIALVRILDIRSGFQQALKDEVLDQVGRGELRPPSIQRLENLLRILIGCKIYHNHLHEFSNDGLDRRCPYLNGFRTVEREPLSCLLAEEVMRLHHPFAAVSDGVIIDRGLSSHDLVKRRTVAVCWPDLEAVLGSLAERFSIRHKWL